MKKIKHEKANILLEAMNSIDDAYLNEALSYTPAGKKAKILRLQGAPVRMISSVAAVAAVVVVGAESRDTFVALIFAMFATPVAMTAAALMAPAIGPAMGPSSWAVEKAVTAPCNILMVAAAMRRFFTRFSSRSVSSPFASNASAIAPSKSAVPVA